MMDRSPVEFPLAPPTHFEREPEPADVFMIRPQIRGETQIGDLSSNQVSSSSYPGTLETLPIRFWLESHLSTTSWLSVSDEFAGWIQAERRAALVKISTASENLFELRRLTGFAWNQLARLLNVDRRTLNNWVKGAKIREKNKEHIAKTLQVLRYADRGSAVLNAAALCELPGPNQPSPLEEIQRGNYENAKRCLSYGIQRPDYWDVTRKLTLGSGGLQPLLMHGSADGKERIAPLPDEPAPASRKRTIRRT